MQYRWEFRLVNMSGSCSYCLASHTVISQLTGEVDTVLNILFRRKLLDRPLWYADFHALGTARHQASLLAFPMTPAQKNKWDGIAQEDHRL